MSQYANIENIFNDIETSLFRTDGKLDYAGVLRALETLVATIQATETDESVWYIGECGSCTLDALLVGAYWFMTDYHGGMNSPEYHCQCVIGEIFNPGMSSLEDESSEKDVYDMLVLKHEEVAA